MRNVRCGQRAQAAPETAKNRSALFDKAHGTDFSACVGRFDQFARHMHLPIGQIRLS
jgi:hypothetical protein